MPATPLPLGQRIELAEAFLTLIWTRIQAGPKSRGGILEDARWRQRNTDDLEAIDLMLDKLLPMYDERALQAIA